ncbi:colanic acid biosynthesis acetyltransferase WcaF [Pedobacter sp. HMF7647]|uniref:Colanic acid biosynthesis acetyltransferase WcaF n=1 Tax=Hufsiella arboris TaxID=2695275 RepID=A0A7K1YEH6_9SPHI|nr:WcaF family extracellular polysaccharide biosynthesis acetyltransferase [Hufsiella arboris]MXV52810.1 colanic acid biosynthesis acetyltransferase WcaF [Hufsiella arboris]
MENRNETDLNKVQLRKDFETGDYDRGASSVKIFLWYLVSVVFIRSGIIPFSVIIEAILKLFGAKIGRDVRIKPGIYIKAPWKLSIDDHSWLADCYIENLAYVRIGKNVCVSQDAMLLTGNHNYKSVNFDLITKEIVLEEGSWIGARAVVCPGVTAGSHSILTVGSIATKNLDAFGIYQGNPAVRVRERVLSSK